MSETRRILAAIPAYNEPRRYAVAKTVAPFATSVLVIDDGSTVPLGAPPAGVRLHRFASNRGYGDVVQFAIETARRECFEALILVDADGQHDVASVPPLLSAVDSADVAVGCRFEPESAQIGVPPPALRREANVFFGSVLRLLCPDFAARDFFSGFLAFRVEAIPADLDLCGSRYASPLRLWPCVSAHRLRVSNIAVPCIYHTDSSARFVAQYGDLQTMCTDLVSEFVDACERFLTLETRMIHSTVRSEITRSFGTSLSRYLEVAVQTLEERASVVVQ